MITARMAFLSVILCPSWAPITTTAMHPPCATCSIAMDTQLYRIDRGTRPNAKSLPHFGSVSTGTSGSVSSVSSLSWLLPSSMRDTKGWKQYNLLQGSPKSLRKPKEVAVHMQLSAGFGQPHQISSICCLREPWKFRTRYLLSENYFSSPRWSTAAQLHTNLKSHIWNWLRSSWLQNPNSRIKTTQAVGRGFPYFQVLTWCAKLHALAVHRPTIRTPFSIELMAQPTGDANLATM